MAEKRPSATEAAALKLMTEIEALRKREQDALKKPKEAEPLRLGRAVVEFIRNNEVLRTKIEQLRSLAECLDSEEAAALRHKVSEHLKNLDDDARERDIPKLRRETAVRVTDTLVGRTRARRTEGVDSGASGAASRRDVPPEAASNIYSPTPIEHHDVLVIAPTGVHSPEQFYRFPVIKAAPSGPATGAAANDKLASLPADDPEREGQYRDRPELLDAFDYGQRRALSYARPQDWGPESVRATQRGPAFSTLPLKPEPNAAAGGDSSQCYLINTQNLNFRNAWTAEEWNDTPGGVDLPPAQGAGQNELETLIAGPQGKVFRLQLNSIAEWRPGTQARIVATICDGATEVQRELGSVESVDLRPHMEVWHQLRGGTAMGRVYFNDTNGPRVIPLVNITTLTRD